jgi:hypothetical protein
MVLHHLEAAAPRVWMQRKGWQAKGSGGRKELECDRRGTRCRCRGSQRPWELEGSGCDKVEAKGKWHPCGGGGGAVQQTQTEAEARVMGSGRGVHDAAVCGAGRKGWEAAYGPRP